MFKWRVISRSNVNGKVHTFQKDFDDYDDYQKFVGENPEYNPSRLFENFWNPWWFLWSHFPHGNELQNPVLPADTKYLPEGIDLDKYEKRRAEKRQSEAEKAMRRQSLERSEAYLKDYLREDPEDTDAKDDLEKIEKELKALA